MLLLEKIIGGHVSLPFAGICFKILRFFLEHSSGYLVFDLNQIFLVLSFLVERF